MIAIVLFGQICTTGHGDLNRGVILVMAFRRFFLALLAFLLVFPLTSARADEVSQAGQNVVRVISIIDGAEGVQAWTGSGFAVSPTLIVTNAHVVAHVYYASGAAVIGIVPSNTRKRITARIVAFDPDKDLALLEVEGIRFTPLKIYGGAFRDGSDVIALGFPGNVDELTNADVIAPLAPRRTAGHFSNMTKVNGVDGLLHDAGIAHGNSGGPLVDRCGRVLGVNTKVSSNNSGDASFGFAISAGELLAFIKREGYNASVVDGECVTPEMAETRRIAAAAKADLEKTKSDLKSQTEADALHQQNMAKTQDLRENRIAVAALLLVMAALAGAIAIVAQHQQRSAGPANWKARIGWGGAALLVLGAAGTFMTRPSFAPGPEPSDASSASGAADAVAADSAPVAAAAVAQSSGRKLVCTIDEGSSHYYQTDPAPVSLAITDQGCVNGRTQYVASGDGAWQRVSVPKSEPAVARLTFDPSDMSYTQERWLPDEVTLATVRATKSEIPKQTCAISAKERTALAAAQRSISSEMTSSPDERLVYRCKAG